MRLNPVLIRSSVLVTSVLVGLLCCMPLQRIFAVTPCEANVNYLAHAQV